MQGELQVMRRQSKQMIDDRVTTGSPLTQDDLDEAEKAVFTELRKWRLELSKKTSVPSFIIFNDRTLVELARQQPKSLTELLNISGIGQAKADKYGQEVLQAIAQVATNK